MVRFKQKLLGKSFLTLFLVVTAIMFASLKVSPVFAGMCDNVSESFIRKHVPLNLFNMKFSIQKKEEVKELGMCAITAALELSGKKIRVVLFATDRAVIVGSVWRFKEDISKNIMTGEALEIWKKHKDRIDKLVAAVYKPDGKIHGILYEIADPECPFCERIKSDVKRLADKYGYEVRLLWYPLKIHPGARGKAVSFLCEGKKFEDYLNNSYGEKQCEDGEKKVEETQKIMNEVEISGTPTFVVANGHIVSGANTGLLEKYMKEGLEK